MADHERNRFGYFYDGDNDGDWFCHADKSRFADSRIWNECCGGRDGGVRNGFTFHNGFLTVFHRRPTGKSAQRIDVCASVNVMGL